MKQNKAFASLINIIYPSCCLICGKYSKDIYCNNCKKILENKLKVTIVNRKNKSDYYEKHIYLFDYKEKIRNLILDYKFNDKSYLYKLFSKIIIKNEKIYGILKNYDIIISVPIHKKRKNKRGYNQSELIAKEIAKSIKEISFENKIIIKEKNNIEQSSLNKKQRSKNVKNVYNVINKQKILNKKIILFDDIYTTGNTVNEISKLLKQNGAKEILVLTIAKD